MQELRSLVIQAQSGDLEAYNQIVYRLQDMAVAYGCSVLNDRGWAEDAAQEAFVEAFFCLSSLQEPAAFPGWLRRIVFKHCDRLARKKRITTVSLDAALDERSQDDEPHTSLETKEATAQVRAAVSALPEHERVTTVLFYMGQHSQQQISEFLEVPVTTVKKRLHTARKRLKEKVFEMVQDNLQEQRPSKDAQFAQRVRKTMADVDPAVKRAFQEQFIQRKEAKAREFMRQNHLSEQVQDKVIAYLNEQEMARRPMLMAAGYLHLALKKPDLPDSELRELLEGYKTALREYEKRRPELEAELLDQIEPHEKLRVQAILIMLFALTLNDEFYPQGHTVLSFDDVDYSPLLQD